MFMGGGDLVRFMLVFFFGWYLRVWDYDWILLFESNLVVE